MKKNVHLSVGLGAIIGLLSIGCEIEDGWYIPEDSVFVCADGMDNDGNGVIDCDEPACQSFRACSGEEYLQGNRDSDSDIDTGEPEVSVQLVGDLLGVDAQGISYNAVTGSVYVTVGSESADYPNSLVAVDDEGTVEWDVYVGDGPGPVAVAHDGSAAFVGIEDAGAVQEVDPETGDLGDIFFVGLHPSSGALHAIDIEVLPDSPRSVALVAAHQLGGAHGVFVFDDGLQRNNIVPWQSNSSYSYPPPKYITVASDSLIYGLTGDILVSVAVHGNDLEITGHVDNAVQQAVDPELVDIKHSSGMIFSMHGDVLDSSGSSLGRCAIPRFQAPILPSQDGTLAYYVTFRDEGMRYFYDLLIYEVATFTLKESILIWATEVAPLRKPETLDMVYWGDTGVAVLLDDRLLLVNNVR